MLLPPPPYDLPPAIPVIEHVVSFAELQAHCGNSINLRSGRQALGCSKLNAHAGRCEIWLPAIGSTDWPGYEYQGFISERLQALSRKHELGHCNGWPDDHRGGIEVEAKYDPLPTTR